jgi:hypothetical protein
MPYVLPSYFGEIGSLSAEPVMLLSLTFSRRFGVGFVDRQVTSLESISNWSINISRMAVCHCNLTPLHPNEVNINYLNLNLHHVNELTIVCQHVGGNKRRPA